MEKVTIKTIEDSASGVNDKTGKSWQLIKITVEGKDPQFKGFANKQTAEWKVGSIVNLSLENDAKWGWQFKIPNATDDLEARVIALEDSVNALLRAVPSAVVSPSIPSPVAPVAQAIVDKTEGEPGFVPTSGDEDDLDPLPF